MMTTEQIVDIMKRMPERDLKQLKQHLEELLNEQANKQKKRGDCIRALAGKAHVGRVLDPLPSRESIYEDTVE